VQRGACLPRNVASLVAAACSSSTTTTTSSSGSSGAEDWAPAAFLPHHLPPSVCAASGHGIGRSGILPHAKRYSFPHGGAVSTT
jgi:hypothetical protein